RRGGRRRRGRHRRSRRRGGRCPPRGCRRASGGTRGRAAPRGPGAVPADLLPRRLRLSRHLPRPVSATREAADPVVAERVWTEEQQRAIDRRRGDLLLDAAAGSGKTSVLVERFVAAVLQDGIDVSAMLTITFTE